MLDAIIDGATTPPRARRSLLRTLEAHFADVIDDRIGVRVGARCWAAADPYLKVRVCTCALIRQSLIPCFFFRRRPRKSSRARYSPTLRVSRARNSRGPSRADSVCRCCSANRKSGVTCTLHPLYSPLHLPSASKLPPPLPRRRRRPTPGQPAVPWNPHLVGKSARSASAASWWSRTRSTHYLRAHSGTRLREARWSWKTQGSLSLRT